MRVNEVIWKWANAKINFYESNADRMLEKKKTLVELKKLIAKL